MAAGSFAAARASTRLFLFSSASLVLCLAAFAGTLALCAVGRPTGRFRARMLRQWGKTTVRILGVRLRVEVAWPEAPFLPVSNHLSYLDIPLLAASAGGVFVAKREVAGWPGLGLMARIGGTIFIDRERKRDVPRVAEAIERAIEQGVGVVLFPEGTSSDGTEVLAFRPPLLEPAARDGPISSPPKAKP